MQGDNLRKRFTFRCMTTGDRPVVILLVRLAVSLCYIYPALDVPDSRSCASLQKSGFSSMPI